MLGIGPRPIQIISYYSIEKYTVFRKLKTQDKAIRNRAYTISYIELVNFTLL